MHAGLPRGGTATPGWAHMDSLQAGDGHALDGNSLPRRAVITSKELNWQGYANSNSQALTGPQSTCKSKGS